LTGVGVGCASIQVTQQKIDALAQGITVDGIRYRPIHVKVITHLRSNTWVEAMLSEGKNRELRRVFGHMGWKVSRLIRIAFGPYSLGDLAPGSVVEVPLKGEVRKWLQQANQRTIAKSTNNNNNDASTTKVTLESPLVPS
jgi:23S rRNA pseudouridine2605 synthase